MLMPKRVKHRKVMRGRMSGQAKGGNSVAFGEFGLVTMEPAWITSRQIEAARRAMTRSVKRGGKIWIRIFPDKPATKKPAETRMGSGKGAPDHWVAVVRPKGERDGHAVAIGTWHGKLWMSSNGRYSEHDTLEDALQSLTRISNFRGKSLEFVPFSLL